jgi:hypothetical protein
MTDCYLRATSVPASTRLVHFDVQARKTIMKTKTKIRAGIIIALIASQSSGAGAGK